MKTMRTSKAIRIVLASLVLAASSTAVAVTTESFVLDGADSFFEGELEGTAVYSDGSVRPGAATERIPIENVPVAFSMARRGDTVFIGTGTDGVVYRIDRKEVKVLAKTGELLVSSLAFGGDGALYAGTLPHGRIYRIDPSSGAMKRFSSPEGAEHVWALFYDEKRNRLIAGTGPEGKVFSIDPIGRAKELYKAEAAHVMALTGDGQGTLYAGTSDNAVVLRIAPNDSISVVHDFPGNEITAIDYHDGSLAVAANQFKTPPGAQFAPAPTPQRSAGKGRIPRPRAGSGQLWRVDLSGRTEALMGRQDTHFTTVQWSRDGAIYAGGGDDGRIFRVEPDGSYSIWADVEERQVLALDLRASNPSFITGDGAALYRVKPGPPKDAVWTSQALDARFSSEWGRLEWRARGRLEFETRSGNTQEPGATWSAWSKGLKKPGRVTSLPGRFIQVRARFPKDPAAVLYAVELFYLPQNQRARVSDVQGSRPPPKRGEEARQPMPPTTVLNLTWKVDNPDGDPLRYRIAYRQESQPVWRPMFGEDTVLTEAKYAWDTGSIPDGHYIVRVDASDEPSNPVTWALCSSATSEAIRVDNHAPRIEKLDVRKGRVRARIVDALGPIVRIQMSIDAGPWRDVFPTDLLLDSASEGLDLSLGELASGSHILAVRAFDAAGNQANREIIVNTKR